VLFYFINLIARKLPLRPLFIITSAFLFAMAIKFIGEAVQEFQEATFLPFTEMKGVSWLGASALSGFVYGVGVRDRVTFVAVLGHPYGPNEERGLFVYGNGSADCMWICI
jgi:hypothetical protein